MGYPVEDHLQILNVIHGYAFAMDGKDLEGVRSLFFEDAIIKAFGVTFSLDEYCAGIPKIVEKMTTVHKISGEYVVAIGDRAMAKSYVLAYHAVPAGLGDPAAESIFGTVNVDTDSLILGRYEHSFAKRNGEWRIIGKEIHLIWQQHLATLPPFPGWAGM